MNKKYAYKKVKQCTKLTFKVIRQLIFSIVLFLLILFFSRISPEFKETAKYYTRKNTDFKAVGRMTYEKLEQCFKEYNGIVDIK